MKDEKKAPWSRAAMATATALDIKTKILAKIFVQPLCRMHGYDVHVASCTYVHV